MKNEKDTVVFCDGRYVLGLEGGDAFIEICGEKYTLSCHPYEPCLYITDKDGALTAVHNAFDPSCVIEAFSEGMTVTSITGTEYGAKDFCMMVEAAAGHLDIQIDEAERVFSGRGKKQPEVKKQIDAAYDTPVRKEAGCIIEDDPFYDLISKYPDSVIDFCLVKNDHAESGYNAHLRALLHAACKLFVDGGEAIWRFDAGRTEGKKMETGELFAEAEENGGLNFRKAFLFPPHTNGYTDADFDMICASLFPNGTDGLEVYEWTTDWSEYFDEGHEWWGALCLTVCDASLDRFAVIFASATD